MYIAAIAAIAGPVVGGLLGSQGSQTSETAQKSIDPRYAPYIYGGNGVLPNAQDWYMQNKSGLNPQMVSGLNTQWGQLANSVPGYQRMQNLGLSMMGGGVAGNPFSMGGQAPTGGMTPSIPTDRTIPAAPTAVPQSSPFQMPQQVYQQPVEPAPAQAPQAAAPTPSFFNQWGDWGRN